MHLEDIHTIDEYLLGRIEGNDKLAFEALLKRDNEFAKLVAERRLLLQQVEAYGELRLREKIQKATATSEQHARRSSFKFLKFVLACLLAAILGIAIWQLVKKTPPPPPQELFATYYEPYQLSFSNRGNTLELQLVEAGQHYKSGNYEQALPIFENVLAAQNEKQDGLILAIGICQLELDQLDNAGQTFQKILLNSSSPYKSQAEWYLALASLKKGDIAATKEILNGIIRNNTKYSTKATELVSRLGE
jgi:tetratricopeptide (TPR) repeat protein